MKLLYVALCDLWEKSEMGIRKKVLGQVKSLEKRYDTYLVTLKNMFLCTFQKGEMTDKRVLLTLADTYEAVESIVEREGIEVIYMRYLKTNAYLNLFLKHMKKKEVKVILEFPTLPYDKEIEGSVILKEDQHYRKALKRYVKYSTNFCGMTSAFGIPSIPINNAIDLDEIPIKKERKGSDIVMIAVASMNFWHGYDRLIKGMANYYAKNSTESKVYLKLVGEGKEIPRYRDLIRVLHMEEYITLNGVKFGQELTELFDQADIAIGSLGAYRKNLYEDSSLKSKEYCARGVPIVLATNDLAFQEESNFIYHVPNDDSDIEIEGIISFYNKWKKTGSREGIRDYAEKYLTWDIIMNKVFEM